MEQNYLFDIHVHTGIVSACGRVDPEDVTGLYATAGYTGIVITDHFHKEYFDSLGGLSWKEKMDRYLAGYRRAKENAHGLAVYLGLEFRNTCTDDDFLVYGLTEEFLYSHPETYLLSWEDAFDLFHRNGAVVIQAHPCRMRLVQCFGKKLKNDFYTIEMLRWLREHPDTPVMEWKEGMRRIHSGQTEEFQSPVFLRVCTLRCPDHLDGVEIYNGNQNWMQNPDELERILKQYPHLIATAASDFHVVSHCARGGIKLPFVPEDSQQLAQALKAGRITGLYHALA